MNTTVRDLLLIIVIVVLCLSIYIARDLKTDMDKRLLALEREVRNLNDYTKCLGETCDNRFGCCMTYWESMGYKWY